MANRFTTPKEMRCIQKQGNRYRVCVKGKYIGIFSDLEQAKKVRDREIQGIVPLGKNANLRFKGFEKRLEKAIASSGLTDTMICKRADISRSQLWSYINLTSEPSIRTLARLSVALDVSTDYLLGLN
jgi:hypothetical protein